MLENSGLHGTARWAYGQDLWDGGLIHHGLPPDAPILGQYGIPELWLGHKGDGCILTVADRGAGKTAALVIPTLLSYTGSVIVTDPKGAVSAQTARYRRNVLGHKVIFLSPWANYLEKHLRVDLPDTGFNPLYKLKEAEDDKELHDIAEMLGMLLCPTPPKINDPEWSDIARSILVGCLKLMAKNPERPVTLNHLAVMVRPGMTEDGKSGWINIAKEMIDFGLDDYAGEILDRLQSPRQFEGYKTRIQNATNPYREGTSLGDHVAKHGFNPADLKRKNVTVYLITPSDKYSEAAKAWLRLVIAILTEEVGRPGPARDVLFFMEEFANLGYMPTIGRAMAQYRESGLKSWLIIQNLDQLNTIYGHDGAKEIISLCETRQFFGLNDLDTAREVSAAIGQTTVRTENQNQQPPQTGRKLLAAAAAYSQHRQTQQNNPNAVKPKATGKILAAAPYLIDAFHQSPSTGYSETGIPLIRPENILHDMPADQQIILRRGWLPIRATLAFYFQDPILWERADPNPYREEGKGPRPLTKEEKEAAAKEAEAKENAPPDWAVKYDNLPIYYHGPFAFIALALMFDYPDDVIWFLDIFLIAFIALGIPSALETVSRGLNWSYKKLKNS